MTDKTVAFPARRIAHDRITLSEIEATTLAKTRNDIRYGIVSDLKRIGQLACLENIIAAESMIVDTDLKITPTARARSPV
ncbi:MAG: hypothetical protein LBF93_08755 [Zoogloeaceae bacterium]|nr:hypothetical protein [Zoogloeaceae bacterium]